MAHRTRPDPLADESKCEGGLVPTPVAERSAAPDLRAQLTSCAQSAEAAQPRN